MGNPIRNPIPALDAPLSNTELAITPCKRSEGWLVSPTRDTGYTNERLGRAEGDRSAGFEAPPVARPLDRRGGNPRAARGEPDLRPDEPRPGDAPDDAAVRRGARDRG